MAQNTIDLRLGAIGSPYGAIDLAQNTLDMSRRALHRMLKQKYSGQYMANYQDKPIDYDHSHKALYRPIDEPIPMSSQPESSLNTEIEEQKVKQTAQDTS